MVKPNLATLRSPIDESPFDEGANADSHMAMLGK
jgi:hypothetical protein